MPEKSFWIRIFWKDRRRSWRCSAGRAVRWWMPKKKVLGFDHAHIGGELCLHWNLPDFVADAIACHHVPSGSRANLLAYIIHAADTIANRINVATFETDLAAAKDDGLKFLQMADKDLEAVAYRILDAVENLEDATY